MKQEIDKNKIKAVIFDFDGVLVNSKRAIFKTYREACKEMGIKFYSSLAEFSKNIDGNYEHFYVRLGIPKKYFKKMSLAYKKHYRKFEKEVSLFSGVENVLKKLKSHGFKVGIVSNTHDYIIKYFLKKFRIAKYIDVVVGGNKIDRLKPDPAEINVAMKKMKVKPEETIFIGDMEVDMIAGRRAKVKNLIAVTYGYHPKSRLKKFNPDEFIEKPSKILNILSIE